MLCQIGLTRCCALLSTHLVIYGFTLYLIADVVQLSNTVYARDFCVFYVLAYLGYLIKPQAM